MSDAPEKMLVRRLRDRKLDRYVNGALTQHRDRLSELAADRIEQLERERDALKRFYEAVTGWREFDHPEAFNRAQADYLADLGCQHMGDQR